MCTYHNRYDCIRLKTKYLGGRWSTVSRPQRNVARSILLKRCIVKMNGLGDHECQVQAHDTKHAWVCPVDETVLGRGCVKFKYRKIEIAVCICELCIFGVHVGFMHVCAAHMYRIGLHVVMS